MDKKVITLLKTQAFIDGAWVGEPRMPVTDKASGEEIARVPAMGAAETNAAIDKRMFWGGFSPILDTAAE